jgi:hypothetical protein
VKKKKKILYHKIKRLSRPANITTTAIIKRVKSRRRGGGRAEEQVLFASQSFS